jgi:hypothetical protein
MPIKINDLEFYGPVRSTDELQDDPGIYAILGEIDQKYYIIDVGESETVKTRTEGHDRKDCWGRKSRGDVFYAALYMPDKQQDERSSIEEEIRNRYQVPCGKS